MRKNQIASDCVQDLFESAANAGQKGQAQYFTPEEVGRALAFALPTYRPVVVDLHCGRGDLLHACANQTTHTLLGCDIARIRALPLSIMSGQREMRVPFHSLQGDITKFFSFLCHVGWLGDVFALNPPWDHHQYREPLAELVRSDCEAVRAAFGCWDGRTPRECIDSCVATLCIALDRSAEHGEGFMVMNRASAERLILNRAGAEAPHSTLKKHVWMTVDLGRAFSVPSVALFFARDHTKSVARHDVDLSTLHCAARNLRTYRAGLEPGKYFETSECVKKWQAAAKGWKDVQSERPVWNIYLESDGTLRTHLTLYDEESVVIPKDEAESLFELNGKRPIQLVVQRPSRNLLMKHAKGGLWRVAPSVIAAIDEAMRDFQSQRAPLWPLPPAMRLGWLDEEDFIRCVKSMSRERDEVTKSPSPPSRNILFIAGQIYPLKTVTVTIRRRSQRRNLAGEYEEVELSGKEIAFIITDERREPRMFRIVRENETACEELNNGLRPLYAAGVTKETKELAPWSLDLLLSHFEIPDVPDIASVQPERFNFYRERLLNLERITEQMHGAA